MWYSNNDLTTKYRRIFLVVLAYSQWPQQSNKRPFGARRWQQFLMTATYEVEKQSTFEIFHCRSKVTSGWCHTSGSELVSALNRGISVSLSVLAFLMVIVLWFHKTLCSSIRSSRGLRRSVSFSDAPKSIIMTEDLQKFGCENGKCKYWRESTPLQNSDLTLLNTYDDPGSSHVRHSYYENASMPFFCKTLTPKRQSSCIRMIRSTQSLSCDDGGRVRISTINTGQKAEK